MTHQGTYEVCEESDEHSSPPRRVGEVQRQTIRVTEHKDVREIKLPLKPRQLQQLQQHDEYCRDIAKKMNREEDLERIFLKENSYCRKAKEVKGIHLYVSQYHQR